MQEFKSLELFQFFGSLLPNVQNVHTLINGDGKTHIFSCILPSWRKIVAQDDQKFPRVEITR